MGSRFFSYVIDSKVVLSIMVIEEVANVSVGYNDGFGTSGGTGYQFLDMGELGSLAELLGSVGKLEYNFNLFTSCLKLQISDRLEYTLVSNSGKTMFHVDFRAADRPTLSFWVKINQADSEAIVKGIGELVATMEASNG